MAARGPPAAGNGSASAGSPAAFTGDVTPRMPKIDCASSISGGNPSRVGTASSSTRPQMPSSAAFHRVFIVRAALSRASVIVLASASRSRTLAPMRSAARPNSSALVAHACASSSAAEAAMTS